MIIDLEATIEKRRRRGGGSRANALLNVFSPTDGVAGSFQDNTLAIRDSVTPANNYSGALLNSTTNLFNKLGVAAASTRYRPNPDWTWTAVGTNFPRVANRGFGNALCIDGATTNLIATNPSAPATQDATVTAAAHTLSFTGTGTITLSGASTAGPLVGTGADNRVTLTFTPSAGTLTMTISGDVRFAKLEARAFASDYSEGSSAAENVTLLSSLFNLNQSAGTFYARVIWNGGTAAGANARAAISCDDGTGSEAHTIYNGSGVASALSLDGAVQQAFMTDVAVADAVQTRVAFAYAANDMAFCQDGRTVKTDATATLATTTVLRLGAFSTANYLFGSVLEFAFFGTRLSNAQLQALTS